MFDTRGLDLSVLENRIALLLYDYKFFLCTFFQIKNDKPFTWSDPPGRRSHFDVICEELTAVFNLETKRLLINVPPGYAKSTMLIYFVAWTMARYPDCQYLYIAYGEELATKHTATIKEIMELKEYGQYFGVFITHDSRAKGSFKTTAGGSIKAFGSAGSITGQDAGLPHCDRYSGGVIFDDAHKPKECHSDTLRESVITNYNETIKPRPRGPNVPIMFIGQRLHEDDLPAFLINGRDGHDWKKVILKALDEAGNPLYPEVDSKEKLLIEKQFNEYVFSAQYQQDPSPAGGGLFKLTDFKLLPIEPKILMTFISVDSAETEAAWNDASVFSLWGIYKITMGGYDTGTYGLHWLDCVELRVEPKDLEAEFMAFYANCMRHTVKVSASVIEKKSSGVTLVSMLKRVPGLRVIPLDRNASGGSKTARFIDCQPFVASGRISLPEHGRHTEMCLTHMSKITANNTHRWDDIADTMQSAIQVTLIENILMPREDDPEMDPLVNALQSQYTSLNNARAYR